jgi:hypothetical protein
MRSVQEGTRATRVLACPPGEPFQTYLLLLLKKLPMDEHSVSVRELKVALQSRIAVLSPYRTRHVKRFGDYVISLYRVLSLIRPSI